MIWPSPMEAPFSRNDLARRIATRTTGFAHNSPDRPSDSVTAKVEPALAGCEAGYSCQFERTGYFFADPEDHAPGKPVFNRTVALRDSWAKKGK